MQVFAGIGVWVAAKSYTICLPPRPPCLKPVGSVSRAGLLACRHPQLFLLPGFCDKSQWFRTALSGLQ